MTSAIVQPHVSQALAVYQSVDGATAAGSPGSSLTPEDLSGDFSALLSRALDGAITAGKQADAQSMQAIAGGGDITSVVTAVSRAQLALQTTVAIRDRVLQAYQDIIKMPI
jgi:flagellar hook-basal body complex protein FliE